MVCRRFAVSPLNYNIVEILLQLLHFHDNKKIYKNNLLNFLVLFSFERYPLQRLFFEQKKVKGKP
ncbi:hypothetical protein A7Q09_05915 [Methylacidiphilum sp. Yel]|nr:hypothetical protein A7Q09_05915 [Methylacidiphilum sp. Yel]